MRHALLVALAALLIVVGIAFAIATPQPILASPTVYVSVGLGHGSGVHLGGGFILTAAHVLDGASEIEVRTSDGRKLKPEVLWSSKKYDLALMRVDGAGIASAALRCTDARTGESVHAVGNPLNLLAVSFWGRVSGPARIIEGMEGPMLPTDITAAGGMSGGPLLDAAGRVVGIVVAVYRAAPITLVVPSSTACALTGRAA